MWFTHLNNYSFPPPLRVISARPQMWKCFCVEVINLRGQSDSSDLSCVLKVLPVGRPAAVVLPGLGAVAAGSR